MFSKDIDLDENIILKNKIPILIEDENWIKLFSDVDDKYIINHKEELEELLKEQKKIENEISSLQKEKLKCMKMILGISDAVNNEEKVESVSLLDEYSGKIYEINDKLDDLTFQLETIPKQIREANYELLKATVKYGYRELKIKEKKLEETTEELEELKERLKELINEKHDYEEWVSGTYTFLHGMLGSKEMEKLDKQILD
ncbi:hypothetical protein [Sporanaerobacter acetigenes]|uniref:Uncharacterized protein n=1 Tax=Sporanaerobacter acetigenes DSM 13106 TaxID=1123281 RepID=A0A1M5YB56_9FIRM|nr:hypothetical protein [Sporanaerobacter acetigenes]SHI09257.1 hypothetical protein SAMN02745180_02086 [Sporanaerobacter acetigenes DSM 13106]